MSIPLNYHANLGLISHYQHTSTSGPAQFKQWNTIGPASKQVGDIFFEDTAWKAIMELAQITDFRGNVSHIYLGSSRYSRFGKGRSHQKKKKAQLVIEYTFCLFRSSRYENLNCRNPTTSLLSSNVTYCK